MRVCPKCSMETDLAVCPDDGATTVGVQTAAETYAPGTVINDRYRIDEVLGIGGFGAVYMCTQANMDQVVAVKVLKSEHLTSVEHVKRFTREARAASKLKHPNTISIFDFGTHSDGALYLAMEYLHGETFANRMDEQTCMKPDTLVHIMGQICNSLTEAHNAGLIHRDLKPENIMLLPVAGDPNFVKVLDFGIAAFETENTPGEEKLTEAGMIMGTPTYMSPEQARGEALDARSDIYALGVMMYEAVCGRVPFDGDQPMTVLVKHIKDPPEPPRAVAPEAGIPRALEKVILRCLEKQPGHRPQKAAELAVALRKALATPDDALRKLEQDESAAPQVDTSEQPTELVKPSATEMLRIATATMPDDGEARPATPPAVPPTTRPRSRMPLWIGLAAFAVVGVVAVIVAMLEFPAPTAPAARTQPDEVITKPAAPPTPAPNLAAKVPTPAPEAAKTDAAKAEAAKAAAGAKAEVASPSKAAAAKEPGDGPTGAKAAGPIAAEAPKAAAAPAKEQPVAKVRKPKVKTPAKKAEAPTQPKVAKPVNEPKAPPPKAGGRSDFVLPD